MSSCQPGPFWLGQSPQKLGVGGAGGRGSRGLRNGTGWGRQHGSLRAIHCISSYFTLSYYYFIFQMRKRNHLLEITCPVKAGLELEPGSDVKARLFSSFAKYTKCYRELYEVRARPKWLTAEVPKRHRERCEDSKGANQWSGKEGKTRAQAPGTGRQWPQPALLDQSHQNQVNRRKRIATSPMSLSLNQPRCQRWVATT